MDIIHEMKYSINSDVELKRLVDLRHWFAAAISSDDLLRHAYLPVFNRRSRLTIMHSK